jgi:hypothetical protein
VLGIMLCSEPHKSLIPCQQKLPEIPSLDVKFA